MILVGRKPVLEALRHPRLDVERLVVDESSRGDGLDELVAVASQLGVPVERSSGRRLDALAGDDRQHQGVVAHFEPPSPVPLGEFLAGRTGRQWDTNVLVLDHVHNPANVGMILRTAGGAGTDGVILPRQGTASIGPVTVKAGAGMVWSTSLIDAATVEQALEELRDASFELLGLDAGGEDLFAMTPRSRAAWILGNETVGLCASSRALVDRTVSLPLANGVESLNVAAAAAVVTYEIARRQQSS